MLQVSRLTDRQVLVALVVGCLGLFGFAFYPIALELSVETTYPVAEATSSGVLMLSGYVAVCTALSGSAATVCD